MHFRKLLSSRTVVAVCLCGMTLATGVGCIGVRKFSDFSQSVADYWQYRSRQAMVREAKAEKSHRDSCLRDKDSPDGEIKEQVKTEYTIRMAKDLEIESIDLDYGQVVQQAKLQAKLDEDYQKALEAYHKLVEDANRKELARSNDQAFGKMSPDSNCCNPVPDCARPPAREQVKLPPPPKRRSLGMENLPIVIRGRYSIQPNQSAYSKSKIERRFVPAKQPCPMPCRPKCPECGESQCRCGDGGRDDRSAFLPPAPPVEDALIQPLTFDRPVFVP